MKKVPLVMCLTNTVAANFTADALLAVGAKPVMVEECEEAGELAAIADATLINVGTVHARQAAAMRNAASMLKAASRPWVLDPVGVQLLRYRRELVRELLAAGPSIVRGNHAEIESLKATDVVTLSTGETDVVTAADQVAHEITGGVRLLQSITATGCVQGGICAAFLGFGYSPVDAALAASRLMKRAGEIAYDRTKSPGTFRCALLDALYEISPLRN